jgi:hypothetical protein
VKFSADVLLSLVNDILDYSKIEAGQLQLERVDFDPERTLEQAVDMISLEAHKKGLEITLDVADDVPTLIRGDPGRFRQVVVNLVKNSVKFTREGGVVVSIRRTEIEGEEALAVAVADTGIGVPVELRPRLFTTFFQGDASTTRRFGGTGLGLAISRHLIQIMGGSIGMSPNEGGGSIFHFTIPAERSEFERPRITASPDGDARILVVDDRPESGRSSSRTWLPSAIRISRKRAPAPKPSGKWIPQQPREDRSRSASSTWSCRRWTDGGWPRRSTATGPSIRPGWC